MSRDDLIATGATNRGTKNGLSLPGTTSVRLLLSFDDGV